MTYDERKSGGLSFFVTLVILAMAGMTAAIAYKSTEARERPSRVFVPVAASTIQPAK
ncbi:hypothetical protein [Rhizobium halophytocola]|uniref:Uncharacterized protein n=1 Tax=Rhizobium halophytocola TaxID=735519 RepID=A0ABS4DWS7_9HYPH|nr:hypothetical protein [Rhizobium halophytocola]MBP1850139.1 hypothetical protein [Rhizobium halophytocola]